MLDLAQRTETPKTTAEVVELVSAGRPLEIIGGGTKRGIGSVTDAETVLSLTGLNKVIDYAPEELVTDRPGRGEAFDRGEAGGRAGPDAAVRAAAPGPVAGR